MTKIVRSGLLFAVLLVITQPVIVGAMQQGGKTTQQNKINDAKRLFDIIAFNGDINLPMKKHKDPRIRNLTKALKTVDVNSRDPDWDDCTVLHEAASRNETKIVRFLVKNGSNIDEQDGAGNSALIIATKAALLDIAKFLIAKKANINIKNKLLETALHTAVVYTCLTSVNDFINEKHVDGYYCPGIHQLYQQECKNGEEIVKFLIKHHANLNEKDGKGNTPLDIAVAYDYINIVKILVQNGAKIDNTTIKRARELKDPNIRNYLVARTTIASMGTKITGNKHHDCKIFFKN